MDFELIFSSHDETDSSGPPTFLKSKGGLKESRKRKVHESRPAKAAAKAHLKTSRHDKHAAVASSSKDHVDLERMEKIIEGLTEAINHYRLPPPFAYSPPPETPQPRTADRVRELYEALTMSLVPIRQRHHGTSIISVNYLME